MKLRGQKKSVAWRNAASLWQFGGTTTFFKNAVGQIKFTRSAGSYVKPSCLDSTEHGNPIQNSLTTHARTQPDKDTQALGASSSTLHSHWKPRNGLFPEESLCPSTWTDTEDRGHIHNVIRLSHEQGKHCATSGHREESRHDHTKWRKGHRDQKLWCTHLTWNRDKVRKGSFPKDKQPHGLQKEA